MKTPVRYVGDRPEFHDYLYGSGETWEFGEVVKVDLPVAIRLVQHPEFEDARPEKERAKVTLKELLSRTPETPVAEEPVEEEPPLVNLESLTKEQLVQYAQRNFGVVLDPGIKKAELIDTVRRQMGKKVA